MRKPVEAAREGRSGLRTQLISVKDGGTLVVRVTPGVRERVDYDALGWVERQGGDLLAPLRAEERLGRVSALDYSFQGSRSVRELVREPIPAECYQNALVSLAMALKLCVDAHLRLSVLLDPEWVFAGPDGSLAFCCVPIQGKALRRHTSLSGLLEALSGPDVRVIGGLGAQVRERLGAFLTEYAGQVDLRLLVLFLASTAGYALGPDLLSVLDEEEPPATEETHGWDQAAEPQTGVGVSWRGVHDRGSLRNYRRDRAAVASGSAPQGPGQASPLPPVVAEAPVAAAPEPHTRVRQPPTAQGELPSRQPAAPLAASYVLVRVSTGEQFRVGEGEEVRLGRGSACTVRVHQDGRRVSRLHATLRCSGGRVFLRDEGSANGTRVGPELLTPHVTREVSMGERFSLADEEFYVRRV